MSSFSDIIQVNNPLSERRCLGSSPHGRCENDIPTVSWVTAWYLLSQEDQQGEQVLYPVVKLLLCSSHEGQAHWFVEGWRTRLQRWEHSLEESRQSPWTLPPPPRSQPSSFSLPVFLFTLREQLESFATLRFYYSGLDSSSRATSSSSPSAPPVLNPVSTQPVLHNTMPSSSSFSGSSSGPNSPFPSAYPATPFPSLSGSGTSTTTTTTTISTPQPKSRYNVTRRQIEGECGICILPFSVDPNNPKLMDVDGDIPMDSECEVLEGESYYDGTSDDADQEEDEELDDYEECDEDDDEGDEVDDDIDDYDGSEDEDAEDEHCDEKSANNSYDIVWCKVKCGTNYHRSCLNTWIETFKNEAFRRPTCPTCRAVWKEQSTVPGS